MSNEIEVNFFFSECELTAIACVNPYRPATMYAKNGDPGDPEEGGDIEDLVIMLGEYDVTGIVSQAVIDEAEESIADYAANYERPE